MDYSDFKTHQSLYLNERMEYFDFKTHRSVYLIATVEWMEILSADKNTGLFAGHLGCIKDSYTRP